ncbi:MAG: hypothetical protein RLZZ511_914 [Cyanobacteriota bacterium]
MGDDRVEGALAAEAAVDEFGGEVAIARWQVGLVEGTIEGNVSKSTPVDVLQGLEGDLASGLGHSK